jgi:hypothetical protein
MRAKFTAQTLKRVLFSSAGLATLLMAATAHFKP